MRRTFKTTAAGLALGLGLATAGSAATLDFLGMADNLGEEAVEFSPSINPIQNSYVPIKTTAIGYSGNSGQDLTDLTDAGAWAYLDSNSAGMGVCSDGINASRQCTDPGDDNIQLGEVLGLSWATSMAIESLSFRGEGHPGEPDFTSPESFDVSFDSGATWSTLELVNAQFGSVTVNGFVEAGDSLLLTTSDTGDNEQYYLSAAEVSAVPVPAAGILMLGAFGGMGGLAALRRRKRAA